MPLFFLIALELPNAGDASRRTPPRMVIPLAAIPRARADGLILYLRGWLAARRTRSPRTSPMARCLVARASFRYGSPSPRPSMRWMTYLLTAHMIQHFILMSIAPPLVVLGAPVVPLLRGLPDGIRPLVAAALPTPSAAPRGAIRHSPHDRMAAMNIAYLGWHIPAAFELTFRSETIHQFEHACFFFTSAAYWWVVLAPWPARRVWRRWTVIPYLLSADMLNTDSVRDARLLGTRALPVLPARRAHLVANTSTGSDRSRRRDVGVELARLSPARGRVDSSHACAARAATPPDYFKAGLVADAW